jgi:hypothetical protein
MPDPIFPVSVVEKIPDSVVLSLGELDESGHV